jgi:microsomal dipeptidase-like Zn-dependent dipeptidase
VVVAHSYGGIPATEALRNLSKSEISKKGGAGGVIRLVYIAAFMVGEGKSCADPVDAIKLQDRTPTSCGHSLHDVCILVF